MIACHDRLALPRDYVRVLWPAPDHLFVSTGSIAPLASHVDTDKNGTIDLDEFMAMMGMIKVHAFARPSDPALPRMLLRGLVL